MKTKYIAGSDEGTMQSMGVMFTDSTAFEPNGTGLKPCVTLFDTPEEALKDFKRIHGTDAVLVYQICPLRWYLQWSESEGNAPPLHC